MIATSTMITRMRRRQSAPANALAVMIVPPIAVNTSSTTRWRTCIAHISPVSDASDLQTDPGQDADGRGHNEGDSRAPRAHQPLGASDEDDRQRQRDDQLDEIVREEHGGERCPPVVRR